MAAAQAAPLATLVLSSIEGALILARAYHDTAPLRRVAASLAQAYGLTPMQPQPRRVRPRPAAPRRGQRGAR